uniref:Uncharacterized protein n=1 Tax=Neobodo designis TaxID=312471 RepID=A0A7S1PYU3_NEODS|mmetsp:Transcript_25337/g.78209  ORF Transcript_25337/g.78209 Transcript_25337/m.78209 type:complete len:224 (+) Transcript_25337:47-718(+)
MQTAKQRKAHRDKARAGMGGDDARPARVLDEEEQEKVIADIRRDADFSAKVFRVAFSAVSVAVAMASVYVVLVHTSPVPASVVPRAHDASQSVTTFNAFVSAVLVVIHAIRVARFRPEVLECPTDDAGKPQPELLNPPPRVGWRVIWGDRFVVGAAIIFGFGMVAVFLTSGGSVAAIVDHRALFAHAWPVLYHAGARLCLGWMQEVQDGIVRVEGCRYHFKSA